jgi:hypothetical protein
VEDGSTRQSGTRTVDEGFDDFDDEAVERIDETGSEDVREWTGSTRIVRTLDDGEGDDERDERDDEQDETDDVGANGKGSENTDDRRDETDDSGEVDR